MEIKEIADTLLEIDALWLTLHSCFAWTINSLECQSVILELTASAAFGKQNPKITEFYIL